MTAQTIGVLIGAGAAVVAVVLSMLRLTFMIGTLTGKVDSFMQTYERDRADILKDIGRIEERHERHIEGRHGGVS